MELYRRIKDGKDHRYMNDLIVKFDQKPDFNPKYDNWRRRAKVPILILNATTLNTCHNWQFTATTMGEPPQGRREDQIDTNARLRRLWYREAPEKYRQVRLGYAGIAVPG